MYDTLVTVMTVVKAITIRRRSGAASSRLIQTFLREGVFYYILISIANLVSSIVTLLLKTGLISAADQRDILPPVS